MRKKADSDIIKWGNDPAKAPGLATRFKMRSRGDENVLLEKNLAAGGRRSGPVRDLESIMMPVFDRFSGERFVPIPYGYVVPKSATKAIELLKLHGVLVSEIDGPSVGVPVEQMVISKFDQAKGAFQGHKLITLEGNWVKSSKPVEGYFVRTGQPLGLLVFDLLQPDSMDGLTAWGAFGEVFPLDSIHPVLRVSLPAKVNLKRN